MGHGSVANKLNIAVLYGGDSAEREVSLQTGGAVAAALKQRGHSVRPLDIRGRKLDQLDDIDCDLAFIALHGPFGEDGQVQFLLEMRGIPYTGSGVEASRLAMDKPAAKERFAVAGIPSPPFVVLDENSHEEERHAAVVGIGFPQIVKPAREGSTIGVTVASSVPEAMSGLETCFALDSRALVEQLVRGRELTVGILGRQPLPIIELVYPGPIFDQHAKYAEGVTKHVIPPDLPEGVAEEVRAGALAAHRALGCRDISRVDMILSEDNTPFVLEVNTIPGMTATSLVPDAARAAGIELPELCETIARRAVGRRVRSDMKPEGASQWARDDRQ